MRYSPHRQPQSVSYAVAANAMYSRRPPSPPDIYLAATSPVELRTRTHTLTPSGKYHQAINMKLGELALVTCKEQQTAVNRALSWSYTDDRKAQRILDYMYMGPISAVRDRAFVQKHNISMAVIVRDARMTSIRLLGVEKACEATGIESRYIYMQSFSQLLQNLPDTIYQINKHVMRACQQKQAPNAASRAANILVACDSGNDRSAAVVTAYVMAVFGASVEKAVKYICIQRCCATFDEDIKRMLQTWQDLLQAKETVTIDSSQTFVDHLPSRPKPKRRVDDMMSIAVDDNETPRECDGDRCTGRDVFVPFTDIE